ncbi:hypothetical protein HOY80DRAFT_885822, partial [Tuber brumale]
WPTLVIECGVSQSQDDLRRDAKWWLKNQEGLVNIVLLFSISSGNQKIRIGKWELLSSGNQQGMGTPSNSDGVTMIQTPTDQIDISYPVSASSSLTVEFAKVFLQDPLPDTLEADTILTTEDLEEWARVFWVAAH